MHPYYVVINDVFSMLVWRDTSDEAIIAAAQKLGVVIAKAHVIGVNAIQECLTKHRHQDMVLPGGTTKDVYPLREKL